MKQVSHWGKAHPIQARAIIAICHILLTIDAVWLGLLSFYHDIVVSAWVSFVLANLFAMACFLYPSKGIHQGLFKHTYVKQKSLDFVLVATLFLLISAGVNRWVAAPVVDNSSTVRAVLSAQKLKPGADEQVSRKEKIGHLKEQIQSIKANLKALKEDLKAKDGGKGGKGWLIALSILLGILLALVITFVVSVLACGIACSGQGGIGILMVALILGWAGVIWLTIIVIRKIARKSAMAG